MTFVLLAVLVTGCDSVGNYKAEKFCSNIDIGSSIDSLLLIAKTKEISNWQNSKQNPSIYKFGFGGFFGTNNICVVTVENGNIIKNYVEIYTLD